MTSCWRRWSGWRRWGARLFRGSGAAPLIDWRLPWESLKHGQPYLSKSAVRNQVRHFGRLEADPTTGSSGRDLILQHMRSMDVLVLLHGTEPICAEYMPSKMYEYLWMQRPILATVHANQQMKAILEKEGHTVIDMPSRSGSNMQLTAELAASLQEFWTLWSSHGLNDSGRESPYRTLTSVNLMRRFVSLEGSLQ